MTEMNPSTARTSVILNNPITLTIYIIKGRRAMEIKPKTGLPLLHWAFRPMTNLCKLWSNPALVSLQMCSCKDLQRRLARHNRFQAKTRA